MILDILSSIDTFTQQTVIDTNGFTLTILWFTQITG